MATTTTLTGRQRRQAIGGIVGVGGFIAAWSVLGLRRAGYSPVEDAISRLAEVGAPDRWWMTLGFLAFGLGVPLYAQALRAALPGPAWIAATITGLATLGVAATPLGRFDAAHGVMALIGYVSLAAVPLFAAVWFRRAGERRWMWASFACGAASSVALLASSWDARHGLSQRSGLLATDVWIVATAWIMWRTGRLVPFAR